MMADNEERIGGAQSADFSIIVPLSDDELRMMLRPMGVSWKRGERDIPALTCEEIARREAAEYEWPEELEVKDA